MPEPFVVGGVLVLGGALPIRDPSPALLDEVARALFEAGDITGAAIPPHR